MLLPGLAVWTSYKWLRRLHYSLTACVSLPYSVTVSISLSLLPGFFPTPLPCLSLWPSLPPLSFSLSVLVCVSLTSTLHSCICGKVYSSGLLLLGPVCVELWARVGNRFGLFLNVNYEESLSSCLFFSLSVQMVRVHVCHVFRKDTQRPLGRGKETQRSQCVALAWRANG